MALRTLELCAGLGTLGLGVAQARPDYRAVGFVERQAFCAATLVARMADSSLESAPIWDDLVTFDPSPWVGAVDLVVAGFPCQGASVAGKRLGVDDPRWLWPQVWRIAVGCGAKYLFIENVPGLVSVNAGGAFQEILEALAARRWVAQWDCVTAAQVGAPHLRERLFLLASAPDGDSVGCSGERFARVPGWGKATHGDDADGCGEARSPADADRELGPEGSGIEVPPRKPNAVGVAASNAGGVAVSGLIAERDQRRSSKRRNPVAVHDGIPGPARGGSSSPADADGSGHEGEDAATRSGARQVPAERDGDWWQRTPAPSRTFRVLDDVDPDGLDGDQNRDWPDRIHALGNANVIEQVEFAWNLLWPRLVGED